MYSREEKLKAVELFIKYDKSPASAIRELGYPCRATLYAWHEEYLANGCRMPSTSAHRRYTEDQKRESTPIPLSPFTPPSSGYLPQANWPSRTPPG